MSILDKVAKLEKKIEALSERKRVRRQPVEIRRAILDDIEDRVEPAGRSRRLLPFTRLSVVVAADPAERPALEAVLEAGRLKEAIREHLQEARCEVEPGLEVSVRFVRKLPAGSDAARPFLITCERRADALRHGAEAGGRGAGRGVSPAVQQTHRAPSASSKGAVKADLQVRPAGLVAPKVSAAGRAGESTSAPLVQAQVVVLKGQATKKVFAITGDCTNIGRLAEVADKDNRVVRRNQVVFVESEDEANRTVSRAQAHIHFVPPGEYRLHDDRSSHGTRVFRDGRTIEIPSGSPRGVRLRPGDEIYFGQACVRFEIKDVAGSR